jgi:hypothetical protein
VRRRCSTIGPSDVMRYKGKSVIITGLTARVRESAAKKTKPAKAYRLKAIGRPPDATVYDQQRIQQSVNKQTHTTGLEN